MARWSRTRHRLLRDQASRVTPLPFAFITYTSVKTFPVEVSDGRLDLRFRAVRQAAVVSAIEVVELPATRSRGSAG